MPNTQADFQAVSLLAEPVRHALYRFVVGAGHAVGRDEAASALDVSRALAAFHLDRLVRDGLLVVEFRRLSGRSGPGAGRPAKLYRRGAREVVVTLPDRRYEVAAHLFAQTIEHLHEQLPLDALRARGRKAGELAGSSARRAAGGRPSRKRLRAALLEALAVAGYEPREATGEIRLGNCPFRTLVDEHRQLVCGMNLAMAEGLIDALGEPYLVARLDPQPDHCCVVIEGRVGA